MDPLIPQNTYNLKTLSRETLSRETQVKLSIFFVQGRVGHSFSRQEDRERQFAFHRKEVFSCCCCCCTMASCLWKVEMYFYEREIFLCMRESGMTNMNMLHVYLRIRYKLESATCIFSVSCCCNAFLS